MGRTRREKRGEKAQDPTESWQLAILTSSLGQKFDCGLQDGDTESFLNRF